MDPRSTATPQPTGQALSAIWAAISGDPTRLRDLVMTGEGQLPSAFPVTALATAAIAAAGLALAECVERQGRPLPAVTVDRRLASLWFAGSLKPEGWSPPPAWDAIAGDYAGRDGFIRLHTNAPHHRRAALAVLGVQENRAAVSEAVSRWDAAALEAAVVAAGGCAAAMLTRAQWNAHPQGIAVAGEPLVAYTATDAGACGFVFAEGSRPLASVRVLDLTRVLAGPVATRFLALAGADVLRIDPPLWDEPGVLPDITPGKRRARLDLKTADGRKRLAVLLAEADILVHGFRPGALDALGFDPQARQVIRPGLIDVSLDAYGFSGPWKDRRGFDSLVQMSSGIAAEGMQHFSSTVPKPLPVQALDHATGFVLAAAALRGLVLRHDSGRGSIWRSSLARVANLLACLPPEADCQPIGPASPADYAQEREHTEWGPALRLRQPLGLSGAALRWDRPAGRLGTDEALWTK